MVTLMKKSLPGYVVNCMLAAGYDDMNVISAMNVSDDQGNSISMIENFIQKHFKGDAEYSHSPTSKSLLPFEFPPGHRIRICNFVNEVKKIHRAKHNNKSQLTCKRKRTLDQPITTAKKLKLSLNPPNEAVHNMEQNSEGLDENIVLNNIRQRINKWIQQQKEIRLRNLKENNDYTIVIKKSSKTASNMVCIICNGCHATINLQKKDSTGLDTSYLLSNWTKHAKQCKAKYAKQHTLKNFLPGHSSNVKTVSKDICPSTSTADKCENTILVKQAAADDYSISATTTRSTAQNVCKHHSCSDSEITSPFNNKTAYLSQDPLLSSSKDSIPRSDAKESDDKTRECLQANNMKPCKELKKSGDDIVSITDQLPDRIKNENGTTECAHDSNPDIDVAGVRAANNRSLFQKVDTSTSSTSSSTDWSRSARNKRSLIIASKDPTQTQITDYWKVLEDIEKLQLKNKYLSEMLQHQLNISSHEKCDYNESLLTPILKQILLNITKNSEKDDKHQRHSETVKKFCTALFIYCGPLAYEFIQHNMKQALTSLRTIQRVLHSEYRTLDEGSFRFDELEKHIELHGCPKIVSIGEDATRIIARVDYDSETDRCVGFVLPLNEKGLPIVDSYLATSFKAIESMFTKSAIAKYAYVYMAQPLKLNAPPFCLACFGTDKFTAVEVMQRWNYIYEECKKRNIHILSYGSDGDS